MSHTIEVPGGTASFYDQDEMTPRRTRYSEEIMIELGDLFDKIAVAAEVSVEGGEQVDKQPELFGENVVIDRRQARLFRELQDCVTWGYLKAWTVDLPLPAEPADLLDLPMDLYNALTVHSHKLNQAAKARGTFDMTGENLENPKSPTGPSDASGARSGGKGRSRTR